MTDEEAYIETLQPDYQKPESEPPVRSSEIVLPQPDSARDDCEACDGKGWYATGNTDNAIQLQCQFCYGTGRRPVRQNDPSSATRPAGRADCNRSAPAGFAAAHG